MADTHTRAALRREIERATQERDRLGVVITYLKERYDALTPSETPKSESRVRPQAKGKRRSARVLPLQTSIQALRERGSPMQTAELAEVIREKGGQVTNVENLYRSLKRGKGIERVGRGLWGLSEWYPNGVPENLSGNGRLEGVEVGSPLSRAANLESRN